MAEKDVQEGSRIRLAKLISKTGLISSGSEARRLIIQGGIEVDGIKETNPDKSSHSNYNNNDVLKLERKNSPWRNSGLQRERAASSM